jgi:hypothetical protein
MKQIGVRILVFVIALQVAGAHAAPLGDNLVRLAPSPFKLPQNIGPLRYLSQNRFRDRRMGRSYSYSASGISLNIYVYDYGLTGIPDGSDSVAACEQFEGARREIEQGGNYQNVVLRAEYSRSIGPDGTPRAREAVYEFDRNGIHAVSVLWLISADGYFLKLRLSLRSEVADELDEASAQVLASVAASLAARPAGTSLEVVSAQEASFRVDSSEDPAEGALWLVYATELTRYSREHPEIRPPCGGDLVADFAAELSARRAALREYLGRDAASRHSNYFDALAKVDAAGFLAEYVWHYLHDDKWGGTPPATLQLDAFEAFRMRELADHAVQSGARVRINAVRLLPVQPPR